MTLDTLFPVRIQDFDDDFTHFLEEFLLVFLLHITAGVCSCLSGPAGTLAGGGHAWLGCGLYCSLRHREVTLRHGNVQRNVHLLLRGHMTGVCLALGLLHGLPLLSLDLLQPGSLLTLL